MDDIDLFIIYIDNIFFYIKTNLIFIYFISILYIIIVKGACNFLGEFPHKKSGQSMLKLRVSMPPNTFYLFLHVGIGCFLDFFEVFVGDHPLPIQLFDFGFVLFELQ